MDAGVEVIPTKAEQEAEAFPSTMWDKVIDAGVQTRTPTLQLREYRIDSVPATIGLLTSLQSLDLSFNQIERLPDEIGQLVQLVHLFVDHNRLESLPSTIGSLTALEVLHVHANQLTHFPQSIMRLSGLRHFKVVLNPQMFDVRQSWLTMPSLQELSATMLARLGNDGCFPTHVHLARHSCSVCNQPFFLQTPFQALRKEVLAGKKILVLDSSLCSSACVNRLMTQNESVQVLNSGISEEVQAHVTQSLTLVSNVLGPAYNQRPRVFVIPPGAGFANEERARILKLFCNVSWPEMPLPEDDFGACIEILKESLHKQKFDLIIAGSRGAPLASALCSSGLYSGRLLLLSACERLPPIKAGAIVTCVHGTGDQIYPIFFVREECAAHENAQIIEFEGDTHDLESLNDAPSLRRVVESALTFEGKSKSEIDAGAAVRVNQKAALLSAIRRGRE